MGSGIFSLEQTHGWSGFWGWSGHWSGRDDPDVKGYMEGFVTGLG